MMKLLYLLKSFNTFHKHDVDRLDQFSPLGNSSRKLFQNGLNCCEEVRTAGTNKE